MERGWGWVVSGSGSGSGKLDLFPLQKIASSDVILALTIFVPVACVSRVLLQ